MSACCPPAGPADAASGACCAQTAETRTAEVPAVPRVHLHLHVPDLGEAVRFYRAFLGIDPTKELADYAKFLPTWAPLNLALSPAADAAPGAAVSHLGIQVATREEVRRHLARVRAAGLDARIELDVDCCHANQDKFWVRDPAGVAWEVYHLNRDLAPERGADASGCCTR